MNQFVAKTENSGIIKPGNILFRVTKQLYLKKSSLFNEPFGYSVFSHAFVMPWFKARKWREKPLCLNTTQE